MKLFLHIFYISYLVLNLCNYYKLVFALVYSRKNNRLGVYIEAQDQIKGRRKQYIEI